MKITIRAELYDPETYYPPWAAKVTFDKDQIKYQYVRCSFSNPYLSLDANTGDTIAVGNDEKKTTSKRVTLFHVYEDGDLGPVTESMAKRLYEESQDRDNTLLREATEDQLIAELSRRKGLTDDC